MADLHPEVLKEIEAGPQPIRKPDTGLYRWETPQEFARRIAALAVEKEREECAKVADSMNYGPCGKFDYGYGEAQEAADSRAEAIAADIRARGKP